MQTLDDDTLEAVYRRLRDEHPRAAIKVADMLLQDGPEEYARQLTGVSKIQAIKQIRAEFGMDLKDAKTLYEQVCGSDD